VIFIGIPLCEVRDVELIIKTDPLKEWFSSCHRAVLEVVRRMCRGSHMTDSECIMLAQQIGQNILSHARNKGVASDEGVLMNATVSEELFTINIPLSSNNEFGVIRMERKGNTVQVNLNFPDPVPFTTQLAFTPIGEKLMHFEGLQLKFKEMAFLLWCEKLKPGLSNPFRDMIADKEL
jgi:hypothetical protein